MWQTALGGQTEFGKYEQKFSPGSIEAQGKKKLRLPRAMDSFTDSANQTESGEEFPGRSRKANWRGSIEMVECTKIVQTASSH